MAVPIPTEAKKFRAAVVPMFICIFVLSALGFLSLLLLRHGRHIDRHGLVWPIEFEAIWSFVWAWMISLCFPAALATEGVYGHSFWGPRRFVRWQDMAAARTFRLFNLRWLRIYSTADNRVTWLPLFQSRRAEFCGEVQRLAPPDSPLLKPLLRGNTPGWFR